MLYKMVLASFNIITNIYAPMYSFYIIGVNMAMCIFIFKNRFFSKKEIISYNEISRITLVVAVFFGIFYTLIQNILVVISWKYIYILFISMFFITGISFGYFLSKSFLLSKEKDFIKYNINFIVISWLFAMFTGYFF